MRVLIEDHHEVQWLVTKIRPPVSTASFIVKGTYRLQPGGTAVPAGSPSPVMGDLFFGDDPQGLLQYSSDFVPFKPRTDLLLVGHGYPPGGRASSTVRVTFSVGTFSKSLVVTGDRIWQKSGPSSPQPFQKMEISYANSFGGAGYAKNPHGKGVAEEMTPDGQRMHRLPNVEHPGRLLKDREERTDPAGFGPIPLTWPQRGDKAGTYDKTWLKTRWPWFPEDLDWTYFNAAPADQQLAEYLRGDETLCFENLHPLHARYESVLPGLRVRAFYAARRGPRLREVRMNLDTLVADLDEEKLLLVWRGLLTLTSDDLAASDVLLVASEPIRSTPKPPGHYAERMRELLKAPEREMEPAEEPVREAPIREAPEAAALPELDPEAELAQLKDQVQAALKAVGVDPNPVPPAPEVLSRKLSDLGIVLPPIPPPPQEEEAPSPVEPSRPPLEPTRESCMARIARGEQLRDLILIGIDLSDLDLQGVGFEGSILTRANLRRSRLSGANFTKAVLSGADLTECDLRKATVIQADLTGANLLRANWSESNLEGSDLSECNLQQANLSGARAPRAILTLADLRKADLRGAQLVGADLSQSMLHEADLSEANLSEAILEGARGHRLKARRADLTDVRGAGADLAESDFRDAKAPASIWRKAVLFGADFTGANLERAEFEEAYLSESRFSTADLRGARMARANLRQAELIRTNLLQANLQRADLTLANFAESNLFGADLFEAIVDRTGFDRANVKRTVLTLT